MTARHRLVVLFGGQSAEHDVSCVTARHVIEAADRSRYELNAIGITREGAWVRADLPALDSGSAQQLPSALQARGEDLAPTDAFDDRGELPVVVLPLLHGPMGEDGTIQGLLDLAAVPYVGAGVLGSALCMDKAMAKHTVAGLGIAQARWQSVHASDIGDDTVAMLRDTLGATLFVKPANMGSSVGVSRTSTEPELRAALDLAASYDERIVVEEAVTAREIEVGVLGNRVLEASVPGEITPADDFYSYDDKYHDGAAVEHIPADLSESQTSEVRELACRAASALRVEGLARVDFFLEEPGRGFLLNEVNTMPGFTPISMFPKLWQASGLSYPVLIDRLVELAIERHERRLSHRRTDH